MPEYRLKLTEEDIDDSRQSTLQELYGFIEKMNGRSLAVIDLDPLQSAQWDEEGDIDYQDEYGRQIVQQVNDGATETLVIRNSDGLPVALGALDPATGWQGLGIDKRLRPEIAALLQNDAADFE